MKLLQTILLVVLVATAVANKCICDEGKYFDEASYTCKVPTQKVENCVIYETNQKCGACSMGFQLTVEQKCEVLTTIIPNCLYTDKIYSGSICSQCNKGYYKKDGKCVANPDTSANCKTFIWEGKVKCEECNDGYYNKYSEGTCGKNSVHIANCEEWENDMYCKKCKSTHYLDKGNPGECKVLPSSFIAIVGCDNYQIQYGESKIKCVECKMYEYGKEDDSCKKCPFVYVYPSSSALLLSVSVLLVGVFTFLF